MDNHMLKPGQIIRYDGPGFKTERLWLIISVDEIRVFLLKRNIVMANRTTLNEYIDAGKWSIVC